MRSSVRSRLAPPIGVGIGRIGSSARVAAPFAIRHWPFAPSGGVRYNRVSPCASRGASAGSGSNERRSSVLVLRVLLSDIVKRKHIRSKDWSWNELRAVARRARSTILSGPGPLEHLSRGPRLTARLPDVFEAKLVFSTEGALPSALSVLPRGASEAIARSILEPALWL